MRYWILGFAGVCLISCASLDSARDQPSVPLVEVIRLHSSDRWRVQYTFPSAVGEVRFFQPGHTFRATNWHVTSPADAIWKMDGRHEILAFASPQRSLTIEFRSDFVRREKGYDFVVAFSDGARLLYTGSLMVGPVHQWIFRSEREDQIVLLDQAAGRLLRWSPASEPEDGSYVYFGSQRPIRRDRMNAIIDSGLPDWIETQIAGTLSRQFDRFTAQLHTELDFRPLIFVSWGGSSSSGRTFKGGTLEGLMVVSLEGEQWLIETAESRRGLYHHLAHEAFHFWDGEMFEPAPEDASWLSESAAEYMALLATRAEGLIDDQAMEQSIRDYEKRCERFSKSEPRSFYTCGVLIQAIVDRASGGRIVDVYRATFVQHYTTDRFLQTLRGFTDREIAARISRLVREGASRMELKRALEETK